MAHQGILDEYSDYNVYEADLKEVQEPLNRSIRSPAVEDWETMRKCFGYITANIICNTYNHSTQRGVLLPSSHFQKRFKSPIPLLNLHGRNEADVTGQIFSDTPTMDGGETSAHIFVGQDSKIVDVYKAKDNSGKEFLGAMQDRVCTRDVPTKLIANNALMYRGWKLTKYHRDLVLPLW